MHHVILGRICQEQIIFACFQVLFRMEGQGEAYPNLITQATLINIYSVKYYADFLFKFVLSDSHQRKHPRSI